MKIKLKAPAKINLFLEITGKRPDGYHNLESIMQTVSLYDEVTVEDCAGDTINLECSDKNLPADESNIVFKAAKALKEHFKIGRGVKIYLKKEIPMGAGLGGGSSDAAATIKALVKLWDIKAEKSELERIAAKLGADVPFFLTGGTALCEGIGDIVTPLRNITRMPIILVNPGFSISTPSVYKQVRLPLTNTIKIHTIKKLICDGSFNEKDAFNYCFNRLEDYVFPNYPEIAGIKSILTDLGCASLMSGSGATVFGIFGSESQSETMNSKLQQYNWTTWLAYPSE